MWRWLMRLAGVVALGAVGYCGSDRFGAPAGVHRLYHPNGQLWIECPIDAQGRLHGEWREYHPSGRLRLIMDVSRGAKGSGTSYLDDAPDVEPAAVE